MREIIGGILNWLGMPGFLRETVYRSSKTADVEVRVKTSRLYTIVSVNGVDVYFDRLTGRIDGTGVASTAGSRWGLAGRSTGVPAPSEPFPGVARSKTP